MKTKRGKEKLNSDKAPLFSWEKYSSETIVVADAKIIQFQSCFNFSSFFLHCNIRLNQSNKLMKKQ